MSVPVRACIAGCCLVALGIAQGSATRDHVVQCLEGMRTSEDPVVIHVIVALCDNEHQGIVPVAPALGDGDDPAKNLYWGAQYGVKTFLTRSAHWQHQRTQIQPSEHVIERCVFAHADHNAILVADAYRGKYIQESTLNFFERIAWEEVESADPLMVVYAGHNGLMDFELPCYPLPDTAASERDIMVLACASKYYFGAMIEHYPAYPLLWTIALCAPEAYVLEAALEAWLDLKDGDAIADAAAAAYALYQGCSMKASKRIFVTGW
jgi:hypothetical protein